jgi:chemotaxis protein histidine kinase CheA
MSAISIVINAVNNAKAAFTSVGNQVVDLNKKLNKAAGVMRGLFAVGIVAKFVKDLVGASSETEKLEGIVGRIKERFGDAATTIGDGIVGILGAIEPVILKVGDFLNFVIDGIKRAAAIAGALLSGAGFKDAIKIADQALAAEKAERAARVEAKKTADEKKKLDKEVADNSIKEAERVAKEREKLEEDIAKLKKKNADLNEKMAEREMSTADKIAKRKQQAEEQWNKYVTALHEGREKAALEHLNTYTELTMEILDLEKERSDVLSEMLDKQEKQLKNQQAQAEAEKLRLEYKKQESEQLAEINALEEQRVKLLERQSALTKESEEKRAQAVDKNFRKEVKEKAREEAREQRRFDNLLENAKRIEAINAKPGLRRGMSEAERLALESERAMDGAEAAGATAEQKRKEIEDERSKMILVLESIDNKIKDVLEMKE